jgi:hypothetical protein
MSSGVDDLTGIVGFAASAIDSLGEWGVGLSTFAETVFPPIPSEVIELCPCLSHQHSWRLYGRCFCIGSARGWDLSAPSGGCPNYPLVEWEDFGKTAGRIKAELTITGAGTDERLEMLTSALSSVVGSSHEGRRDAAPAVWASSRPNRNAAP